MSNTKILNTDHKYLDLAGLQEFQGKVKTYVEESINNVEIGGTNLILNSDFSQRKDHWSVWSLGTLSVTDKVATFSLSNTQTHGILQTSAFYIASGEEYMASFDIRSDNLSSLNYCFLMSSSGNIPLPFTQTITTAWQRIEYKFKATATGNYMFGFGMRKSEGKSFQIKRVKIEKGNKATDWSPAPEDLPTKAGVINLISASDLELGAIADATGANSTTTNANRARTAGYIPVTSSQLALKSWTDGVVFYLWTYDANKNPIQMSYSSTGWISSGQAYTLPEGTAYIRLVLKKNSGANFTTSELPTIKIKAEYSNKITEWCPSVDDVQNQINSLKSEIAALKAVINEITNANLS